MNIFVMFSSIGVDAGPFNLFSDIDGYTAAFETGITSLQLTSGFPSPNAPNGTTIVRAKSIGACDNYVDIPISGVSTTTTTTSGIMVLPVLASCCGGMNTEYILYNPAFSIGSVVASTTEGFLGGYEVTGAPVIGTPTITILDNTDYGSCGYFLAFWAGSACV